MKSALNRQILALAIPAIVANITTPLLSLVDVAIVGHLGSAAYVGAIAVGGSIFSMLYWLFSFLRFGTSGLTAQAVGSNRPAERQLILQRALAIGLLCSLILILLHNPLGSLALRFIDCNDETRALALLYFNILIYGAPAVMMQYALTGWFVGSQNTKTPMWVSLIINVVNIAASLVLVFGFRLSIRGVAFGTLSAQWIGTIVALIWAKPRLQPLSKILELNQLKRFFNININIFLRTLCLIAVTVWFTRAGSRQGTEILAVNTLLLQLFILFSYFMDGFAFAAEALCGKLYGAKDSIGLKICIRRILQWGFAVAVVFTVIYALGGEAFLRLLTDDSGIIQASEAYRLWGILIPLAGFMAFTWDGIIIGVTKTRLMLQSMAASTLAFFALWFLLSPSLGNHALWIAFLIYLLLRGVLISLMWRRIQVF